MNLKGAELGYGQGASEKVILRNVRFLLQNGDHLAVVGVNGAGKSTLLKALAGLLPPLRGEVESGYQVSIGYFAQHVAENLRPGDTALEAMTRDAHPDVTRQEGLNLAGSLLFSGDDVHKKISVLSGGEKARVALGRILLQRCPCLILDEPTNHLDFQTVEALTQALVKYSGTVVIVSHDRSFVRRVGTKILEIRNGSVELYPGTYDDYVWSVQKGALSQRVAAPPAQKPAQNLAQKTDTAALGAKSASLSGPAGGYKEQRKLLDKVLRQAERRIEEIDSLLPQQQEKLHHLNDRIGETSGAELSKLIQEIGEIQNVIDQLESDWLAMSERREQTQSQLKELTGG